jgi:hypothetical protein
VDGQGHDLATTSRPPPGLATAVLGLASKGPIAAGLNLVNMAPSCLTTGPALGVAPFYLKLSPSHAPPPTAMPPSNVAAAQSTLPITLRRRLSTGRRAIEGRDGSGCLSLHGEILKEKLVEDGVEGGEGHNPLDESHQVVVVGVEAMQKVQHQGTVGDGLAEAAERVCHALHLVAVLAHGEVP